MARIVVDCYLVRYPLGGMMSWVLQYLRGLLELGHDVYVIENGDYPNACFDPARNVQSDDSSYGIRAAFEALTKIGLQDRFCYLGRGNNYHGLSRAALGDVLKSADVFLELGDFSSWMEDVQESAVRVFVDGDPGMTQMKLAKYQAEGGSLPSFDHYFTVGRNVGLPGCPIPTAGIEWKSTFHPVCTKMFRLQSSPEGAYFTTVMNWQSYEPVMYEGRTYGHKDVEFEKFMDLPQLTAAPLEIAVAGRIPEKRLRRNGWRLQDGHAVTVSFDSFAEYVVRSRGEFTVCKNAFVRTRSGWFGDRSAAYLASGRPVVMQGTGFSGHLPCGRGLFSVDSSEEAAAALDEINSRYEFHVRAARDIAMEYLDAPRVMGKLLSVLGA